jgi:hypothetical protein
MATKFELKQLEKMKLEQEKKMYSEKLVTELIIQFKNWESGHAEPLTYDQCSVVLASEEHEAFMFDHGLYRDIMDFRDHLESEMEPDLDGFYENQRMQCYNA